ncbi:MAG: MATE family efflux transporter [Oscillospiraceae bacterium]|nr:MATE family efflux transporter [Oscillospiraceae bacterium]
MEEDIMTEAREAGVEKNDFSKGSVSRAILGLALPMTLAQLINLLYSIVDRIYLGHMPGAEHLALTGVGLTLPIINIVMSVAALCGTGGGPLFSIARGRRDDDEAERTMGNSFAILLIFGAVMTIAVIIFKKPILYLFGASDNTYPYAGGYLSIYMIGTLFVMIGLGMNPFINAQGFGRMGMLTVAIGAAINIVLDPIFIFVFGMGVSGAALATIIAQFCSAVWVLRFLTGKKALLHLKLSCMRLQAARVRKILTLGLAGFIMNLTTSLTQIVCNVTLQRYGGDLYVGVMAVINSLREVIMMPISGMSNGSVPVIGFNLGAEKFDRVRRAIKFSVSGTLLYSAVIWAVVMLVPGALIRIFNTEPDLIAAGIPAMRIYFALFIFMSLQMSTQNVFLGLGRSKNAIFFSLLRKAFIAAPLTVIFPLAGFGKNGVFYAEAASQLIGGIACFSTMYLVVYRHLSHRDSV